VITLGANQSQITIYSDHHDEIRSALLGEADVGMTSYLAETGFQMKNIKYVKKRGFRSASEASLFICSC
jgi:hypothetical protein